MNEDLINNRIAELADAAFSLAALEEMWIFGYTLVYEGDKLYEKYIDGTKVERIKYTHE